MITTPFYIEKRKPDGAWLLKDRHDVCVMEFVHEEAAKCHRDLCNETFQDGFAYCIDLTAKEAKALEAKRIQRAHEAAKSGVADMAIAAGTVQPAGTTAPPESMLSKAIAKVRFVFDSIKESGNA